MSLVEEAIQKHYIFSSYYLRIPNIVRHSLHASNAVLNKSYKFMQDTNGNSSVKISDCYRTSTGNLCIKVDRGTNSYSEGVAQIYIAGHDSHPFANIRVMNYKQNDTSGAVYT